MKYASVLDRMAGSGSQWWETHHAAVQDRAAGADVVLLSVGEIDLPPPRAMQERAAERLLDGRHKYSAARGEAHVREALAKKYSARTGRDITPDHVIFANGAQTCLALLLQSLLNPGDEILIPEPRYITYGGVTTAAGGQIVPVPLRPEDGFHPRVADIAAAITPKSRAIVLNTPHNPTGATLSAAEIEAIGQLAIEHDLWIISDEVYEDYVYSGTFASPFDQPQLADRTFAIGSLSKSHAVPGWRCGWVIGPPAMLALATRLFEIVIFSTPPFLQDAAAFALENEFPESTDTRRILAERAQRMPAMLSQAPGLHANCPEGGIFLFLDVRETGKAGVEFARELYAAEKVSVMPGEAFGVGGEGHVRLCIGASERDTDEACVRIRRFANAIA